MAHFHYEKSPKLIPNEHPLPALAWRNLRFTVSTFTGWKMKEKTLLRRLNGSFQSGTLNGLLGPSGAGKTTLLNCLAGSTTSGLSPETEIYSAERSPTSFFIAQHVTESIVGELTGGQILRYAYKFKNGNKRSADAEMEKAITRVLTDLLLDPSILGRPFAVCSGGEQKRIAIAQELMAVNRVPSFLFLDEPTSGLDSAAALEVMASLQRLARTQRITIIASIHAPNNETLSLFDQLYVLAQGGVAIYSGPPAGIRAFLQSELQLTIPPAQPPIELLLKISCTGSSSPSVQTLAKITLSSPSILELPTTQMTLHSAGLPTPTRSFSFSTLSTQIHRLTRITFLARYRSFLNLTLLFLVFFVVLSSIFRSDIASASGCLSLTSNCTSTSALSYSDEALVRENGHYLSFVVVVLTFITMLTSTVLYSTHIKVFRSEHRNTWYSLTVFYLSTNLIAFIELNYFTFLISGLSFYLSSQHAADDYTLNWARLALYTFYLWLYALYYQTLAQLVGALLVDNVKVAVVFVQFLYAFTSLFNGLFIKLHRSPWTVLEQVNRLFAFGYITQGLQYSLYGFERCIPEMEVSSVLIDFNVNEEMLGQNIGKVLVNVLLIKVATFLVLYGKFGDCHKRLTAEYSSSSFKELIPIDFSPKRSSVEKRDKKHACVKVQEFRQTKEETEFTHFIHRKILIGWRNLSLYGSSSLFEGVPENEKPILRNLNGQFCFGTLNALMGTSGAGKTSLLKVLNGRAKTRLSDETEMYLSKYTKITTCFITQEVSGHLMTGLTARQLMIYASRFKNVQQGVDHEAIALKWLQELDLLGTSQTKVEKCSGGERKRLAVALELTALAMPNCVCIDEPTSGLDTNSAEIVISTLRLLTRNHPMTIITSIHQPTSEVLYLFDSLYVLARGGVCIFSGPPSSISTHLLTISPTQPPSQYPIESLIKYSCSSYLNPTIQALTHLTRNQFQESTCKRLFNEAQHAPGGLLRNRQRFSLHAVSILSLRFLVYIRGHLWKEYSFNLLNYIGYGIALITFFPTATMITVSGCVNLQEDDLNASSCTQTPESLEASLLLKDNLCYAYFTTNIYLLLILGISSVNFLSEYAYFANEHRNGWYSTGVFYLTKSIFEILPLLPTNLLFVAIINVYDPIYPSGSGQSMYWHLVYLLTLAAIGFQGFAHVFNLLARGNLLLHMLLLICGYLLLAILGNYNIPMTRMHYVYQILSCLSIPRFIFEASVLLQYGFGRCPPGYFQPLLALMDLKDGDFYRAIYMLLANLILYRVIAIWLLIRRVNPVEETRKRQQQSINSSSNSRETFLST